MKTEHYIIGAQTVVLLFIVVAIFGPSYRHLPGTMDHKHAEFMELKESIIGENIQQGEYACCLKSPCTSCIEHAHHGEKTQCACLEDVMNGRAPCGECLGGILSGRGNPYIAEYFAESIAEKTGEKEAIMRIIEEQYGVPVGEQI